MQDEIEFIHRDKNGKIINKWTSEGKPHKCIVAVGMANMAGLLVADVGGTGYDYIAIGTGVTGALVGDHQLETQIGVRQLTTGTRVTTIETNDTAQWVAIFSKAIDGTLTGAAVSVTEVGVFFHLSNDNTMLFRQTFAAEVMNWDAGDTLQMTCKMQIKQGV